MQASLFRKLAAYLLQTHYGLDLDDTTLSEDYPAGVAQGDRVFLLINMLSNKYDLQRLDSKDNQPLSIFDEVKGLAATSLTLVLGEQQTCCPLCGHRTNFTELNCTTQIHDCMNPNCENVFITQFDQEIHQ